MHVMVRSRLKPEQVERNLRLLRAVYDELKTARPEGLRYKTFQLDDEVTFLDVVAFGAFFGLSAAYVDGQGPGDPRPCPNIVAGLLS